MIESRSAFAWNILVQRKIAACCFLFLVLPACASAPIALSVKQDSGLTRTRTLKVFAEHGDPVGVKAKLERLLVAKGFRLAATPEEKTDYVLHFRYVFLTGFRSFSAVIADTSKNEVVAVAEFEGYRLGDGLFEEFVAKLADQVH